MATGFRASIPEDKMLSLEKFFQRARKVLPPEQVTTDDLLWALLMVSLEEYE